jgi:dynamin 1-like protein
LITSYFSVVKVSIAVLASVSYTHASQREMIDMVPKAITLTLVNYAKENLQRELLEHLYSESALTCIALGLHDAEPDVLDELLKESPEVVARRKECVKMVTALNAAEAM